LPQKKIRDTDFLYLTSMLRAREAKMLGAERLDRVLDAPDFREAAKLVHESGYPDMSGMSPEEIDNALGEYRTQVFRYVEACEAGVVLLDIFRIKYDYHNVKVLVKAMAANVPGDHLLSSSGRIPVTKLTEAFITGDRRDLRRALRTPSAAPSASSPVRATLSFPTSISTGTISRNSRRWPAK
jgi:V/A-type H+-transporting ATPase subunit C